MTTVVIILTLASTSWSLWVRRFTWHCQWELATTLNVALQACAVLLLAPVTSATLGRLLYAVTGEWNLEDLVGNDCYIVAAASLVHTSLGRLEDGPEFQRLYKQHVERPLTVCIPLLLVTFSLGNGVKVYRPDASDVPTDLWLDAYWILLSATVAYLLAYTSSALLILRQDPRSRRSANVYLFACFGGIIACFVRVVCVIDNNFESDAGRDTIWILACVCGAAFSLMSGYTWIQKNRWLKTALWRKIALRSSSPRPQPEHSKFN